MDESVIPPRPRALHGIRLQYFTPEEIQRVSVVKITSASLNERGVAKFGGVNDPRMGVMDRHMPCPTCGLINCDQHYGHIELEAPVFYTDRVIETLLLIMKCVCRCCAAPRFRWQEEQPSDVPAATWTKLVNAAAVVEGLPPVGRDRLRAIAKACKSKLVCWSCGAPQPVSYKRVNSLFVGHVYREKESRLFESAEEAAALTARMFPSDVLAVLEAVPDAAYRMLGFQPDVVHPRVLVPTMQLVPPPCIRPASHADGKGRSGENDMTIALQEIVRANNDLAAAKAKHSIPDVSLVSGPMPPDVEHAWDKLQILCAAFVNNNFKKVQTFNGQSLLHGMTLRRVNDLHQRLTGKYGRFRRNLSGRRVDFSARSVIGPDSSHDIWQLGVPQSIMQTLTFPEPVTDLNVEDMAERVRLGPNVADGAVQVKSPEAGGVPSKTLFLGVLDAAARADLASQLTPGWVVERYLRDGDINAFNRQPTLRKESVQGYQIYGVPCLQFKLPLPCTKPFNADFDGDEMNLHALQTYMAVAEAMVMMIVPMQIVTPQSSSVLIGLVQDSLVGAYKMTRKDALINRAAVMDLLMHVHYASRDVKDYEAEVMHGRLRVGEKPVLRLRLVEWLGRVDAAAAGRCPLVDAVLPCPAILKGTTWAADGTRVTHGPLWTGKQIVSWMLPSGLRMTKGVRDGNAASVTDLMNTENVVVVEDGHLLAGQLCKATMGAVTGGFVHEIHKMHGGWGAAKFISDAQRVLMQWLKTDTVCISVRDCLVDDSVVAAVDDLCATAVGKVDAILAIKNAPEDVKEMRQLELLSGVMKEAGALVVEKFDRRNGLSVVVNSGAKGNLLNIAQIGGLVGQQVVNNLRLQPRQGPLGKRILLCDAPDDVSAIPRGFVVSSFERGLTPREFYQHQMSGRVGTVSTACNTAEAGYAQRRMVTPQVGDVVAYDATVRASSHLVVQMHYGGDDYDASRTERVKLDWLLTVSDAALLRATVLDVQRGSASEATLQACAADEARRVVAVRALLRRLRLDANPAVMAADALAEVSLPVNFASLLKARVVHGGARQGHHKAFTRAAAVLRHLSLFMLRCHDMLASNNSQQQQRSHSGKGLDALLGLDAAAAVDDPCLITRLVLALQCTSASVDALDDAALRAVVRDYKRQYVRGLVAPGEGVGAVGATSIGEPSTQLVLSLFHYSGIAEKQVRGLPRFKEIIDAVDTFDTASMIIPLDTATFGQGQLGAQAAAKNVAFSLSQTTVGAIVDRVLVKHTPAPTLAPAALHVTATAAVECSLLEARARTMAAVLAATSSVQPATSRMPLSVTKRIGAATKRTAAASASDGVGSAQTDSAVLTASSTAALTVREKAAKRRAVRTVAAGLSPWVIEFRMDKDACMQRRVDVSAVGRAVADAFGVEAVVAHSERFSAAWCVWLRVASWGDEASDRMVADAVLEGVSSLLVSGVARISRAAAVLDAQTQTVYGAAPDGSFKADPLWCLHTVGSDMTAVARVPGVQALHMSTNNVKEVEAVLGIGAAEAVLQAELQAVLVADGSYVHPHHTWLLANTMCRGGKVVALNRHKLEELGTSLLPRAAFEQTFDVLQDGAIFGKRDALGGATEKMMVGQPVNIGTGAFDILEPLAVVQPTATIVGPLRKQHLHIRDKLSSKHAQKPHHNGRNGRNQASPLPTPTRVPALALRRHQEPPAWHEGAAPTAPIIPPLLRSATNSSQELSSLVAVPDLASSLRVGGRNEFSSTRNEWLSSRAARGHGAVVAPRVLCLPLESTDALPPSAWSLADAACVSSMVPVLTAVRVAAQTRDLLMLRARAQLSAAQFATLVAAMDAYRAWVHRPSSTWEQTVKVVFDAPGVPSGQCCTVVSYEELGGDASTSVLLGQPTVTAVDHAVRAVHAARQRRAVAQFTARGGVAVRVAAQAWTRLALDDVPSSVVPSAVCIRHRRTFSKGPWLFTLERAWRGATLMEAEARQHAVGAIDASSAADHSVLVTHAGVESLLETRAGTDAALAHCVWQRMLALLQCVTE